jgi:hypothetical protein
MKAAHPAIPSDLCRFTEKKSTQGMKCDDPDRGKVQTE